MALGISFIPNQTAPDQQQPSPQQNAPLQQALQMISLRVPRFTNSNAILPQQMQQRQPGTPLPPMPGTPEWEELMRRLAGGWTPSPTMKYPGQPPAQPDAPLPAPNPGWKFGDPVGPGGGDNVPPPDQAPPGKYWPGPGGITKTFDPYPDQKMY